MLKTPPVKTLGLLLTIVTLMACQPQPSQIYLSQWQLFKNQFLTTQGQVIDTGNGQISHSEGQGYGLLFAAKAVDKATFETIWRWTQQNLQVRDDHLFIWRRQPNLPLASEDKNNASDGDIVIAWALLEAAKHWPHKNYQQRAHEIITDVRKKLVTQWRQQPVLLPGHYGFKKPEALTINLSYWVYPAFEQFALIDSPNFWHELANSGLTLLPDAQFGHWNLPPNWLKLNHTAQVSEHDKPHFGYDAIRIPLYLIWGEKATQQNLAAYSRVYSQHTKKLPAWFDLNDNSSSQYPADHGIASVYQLIRYRTGKTDTLQLHSIAKDDHYYTASLLLLTRLAAEGA